MKLTRENVQPRRGSSFARLEFDLPEFDTHYHYHPEIEITWIVSSEGQRLIGDAIESFHPGDLALIGSNVPHQYRNWRRGRARSKVIQFRQDLFGPELLDLPEFASIHRLLKRASRGLRFSKGVANASVRQMNRVFEATDGPSPIIELLELLKLLSGDAESSPIASVVYSEQIKIKKINRLQRALNYLESHWRDTVSLSDVAKAAALHPQSVSRFFRQHLGMNFQEYLARLRLSRATRLLLETDRTIVDIAFHCGFNNLSNFNRRFQSAYRQTPTAYRNKRL